MPTNCGTRAPAAAACAVAAVERFSGRLERAAGAAFTALPADASNFTARLNLPMD